MTPPSIWAAQITPDNVPELIEIGARFGLNLDYITDTMEFNAQDGKETWLMMFNPQDRRITTFDEIVGTELEERYIRIPVYHPEGHFQEFVVNH